MFSLPVLEHQLVMYVTADGRDTFSKAFDLSNVPIVTREQADAEDRTKKLKTTTPTLKAPTMNAKAAAKTGSEALAAVAASTQKYAQQLQSIPEIAAYGSVLKSSPVIELTETEMEYVVTAVKHLFKEHLVIQYDIKNTLPEVTLTDVSVVATPVEEDSFEEDFIIPTAKLAVNEPGTVYVAFKRNTAYLSTTFTNVLKFTTKEIDPTTGEPDEPGFEDEYQVEDLELNGSDWVVPAFASSFESVWAQIDGEQSTETLQLSSMKSISGTFIRSTSQVHIWLHV